MQEQICKNCGNRFSGKYCNSCGEKVYAEKDKSITHFFEEALHFFTHFEGAFIKTLKTILSKPGLFSLEYCNGIRKKYFKPLPFFLMLVVLYLFFPLFSGLNMPFHFYLSGEKTQQLVAGKTNQNIHLLDSVSTIVALQSRTKKDADFFYYKFKATDSLVKSNPALNIVAEKYSRKSEKISKLLLLILLPLTAVVLWVLSFYRKKFFFDHLVLATEINSFFIIFSFFLVPFIEIIIWSLSPAIMRALSDFKVTVGSYFVEAIFCTIAFKRFYNDKWYIAFPKGLVAMTAHYFIVQDIYKFLLFVVTLYLSA